jgi:4-amino-4-deoxy-L-arabinose transferase-like glycosyltransferase
VNSEPSSRLRHLAGFAIVTIAWVLCASRAIDLPGVYMDAVNPDYLVVRVFTWERTPMAAWVLPGNHLFGARFPILVSLYHGTQHFWLGLPLFWLFGTTVESLRIVHALFGLGVLAALYALLAAVRTPAWLATLAAGALALDPAFLFAFRTQSHITMAPAAWLLLALLLLARAHRDRPAPRAIVASGLCAGLAVQGYFVYGFFVPALVAGAWLWSRSRSGPGAATGDVARFGLGLVLGVSGYLLGYALVAREEGGFGALVAYLADQQRSLGAFASPMTLAERVRFVAAMVAGVFGNGWHHSLIFGEADYRLPGTAAKMLLLLGAPLALLALAERRGSATPMQRLVVALAPTFCLFALIFGGRLGGHHFMSLLPLGYAALALGLADVVRCADASRGIARAATLAAFALLAAYNIQGHREEMAQLVATRGVGLFSDAVNRLPTDLMAQARKPYVFFPDWGLALPFAFLTRASVPSTSGGTPALGRRLLCEGRDVAIALIEGDRAARRDEWQAALSWDAPLVQTYRQADGGVVFELATFAGRVDAPSCAVGDTAR